MNINANIETAETVREKAKAALGFDLSSALDLVKRGDFDSDEAYLDACTRAELERSFAAAGVRILEDTSVLLPCGVRIVGRKDYLYTNGSRFTAAQLMPGGPDDRYTVWLDHEPRDFKAAAAAGADLILSGHTHGGQVWPAGAVGMVAKNERNYGKKVINDHCTAIVSGGTGTWGYKFRTQGRTEIVCVEITTEKEM